MALNGTNNWAKLNSGFLGDLSDEQATALKEFHAGIPEDDLNFIKMKHDTRDSVALRFLRARKFDVAESLKMAKDCVVWAREKRPQELAQRSAEDILGCSDDEMRFFYPHVMARTFDKQGRNLYCERTGQVDVEAMLLLTTHEKLVENHIRLMEGPQADLFAWCTEQSGSDHPIDQVVAVMDLKGMSRQQLSSTVMNYVKDVTGLDSLRYPERMGKTFVINAPGIFSLAWKVIKAFLDPRTASKISISSGDSKKELLECFGADRLPVELGGDLVIEGGLFPVSRTIKFNVGRGSKSTQTHQVTSLDGITAIESCWFCRGGDGLTFSVTFTGPDGTEAVVLAPQKRGATSLFREQWVPASVGFYTFTLDNSGGWVSRDVYWRVNVKTPKPSSAGPETDDAAEEPATAVGAGAGATGAGTGAGAPSEPAADAATPAAEGDAAAEAEPAAESA